MSRRRRNRQRAEEEVKETVQETPQQTIEEVFKQGVEINTDDYDETPIEEVVEKIETEHKQDLDIYFDKEEMVLDDKKELVEEVEKEVSVVVEEKQEEVEQPVEKPEEPVQEEVTLPRNRKKRRKQKRKEATEQLIEQKQEEVKEESKDKPTDSKTVKPVEKKVSKRQLRKQQDFEDIKDRKIFKYKNKKYSKVEDFIKYLNDNFLDIEKIAEEVMKDENFLGWVSKKSGVFKESMEQFNALKEEIENN